MGRTSSARVKGKWEGNGWQGNRAEQKRRPLRCARCAERGRIMGRTSSALLDKALGVRFGTDHFGGAGGRGHRQDARGTLDKRTGHLGCGRRLAPPDLTPPLH